MPNRRGQITGQLETAWPWRSGRYADAEPQDRRGDPGSRNVGSLARARESHRPGEWCGVNPLPPIDPAMPVLKTGDQGG